MASKNSKFEILFVFISFFSSKQLFESIFEDSSAGIENPSLKILKKKKNHFVKIKKKKNSPKFKFC